MKRYRLSFYANKRGLYHNKRFTFDCSSPEECCRLLYHFLIHSNTYNSIYVTDVFLHINYELPRSAVENYQLSPSHFKCSL